MQERAMTASSSGKGDERIIRAKESLGLSPAPQGLSIHCFCLFGKTWLAGRRAVIGKLAPD